jgi:hypothetical protein
MFQHAHKLGLFVSFVPVVLLGCKQDALTHQEAVDAMTESSVESQASALTSAPIEISTNFTLGSAVEAAATQLHDFLVAELPCAKVTVSGATVTTDWGAAGSGCTYKGLTYSGESSVTIMRTDSSDIEVDHNWTNFSNGVVEVSGNAQVTWSSASFSRHVVHQLTWTRLSDNRTGTGTGDRTQTLIDPSQGLLGGFRVDGNRHWTGESGTWDLAITGVEIRLQDPVPQAGTYQLTTPSDKVVSLSFARQTPDVIQVTLTAPKTTFSFDVHETGAISG